MQACVAAAGTRRPRMHPASHFCQRILPMLQGWGGRLRSEFPAVTANATELAGPCLALACTLRDVAPGQPDVVTLSVCLHDRDGTLMIRSADVAWGRPSGHVEAEVRPTRAELTPECIEEFADRLPELFAALRAAIRRGHPPT